MSEIRTIRKIVTGTPTQDGAGVKLVRVIGKADTTDFDPFLMLDAFDSLGFRNGFIQELESGGHYNPDFDREHPFEGR